MRPLGDEYVKQISACLPCDERLTPSTSLIVRGTLFSLYAQNNLLYMYTRSIDIILHAHYILTRRAIIEQEKVKRRKKIVNLCNNLL